ncbi:MAG: hypothetical protein ACYCU8_00960 [Ferrimicrobium acidiphilum]
MYSPRTEDGLLHEIELSDTDSIRTMIAEHAEESPIAKQARTAALFSIGRKQAYGSYWSSVTRVKMAMNHRADDIGSFTAHVIYDAAIIYALDELLAVYASNDLSSRYHDALHAAWQCQLNALSVGV